MSPEPASDAIPSDIRGPMDVAELLLKRPIQIIHLALTPYRHRLLLWLLVVTVASAAAYGLVVGSFAGGCQFWVAALKLPLGIVASAVFCLPGLYIAACLSGREVKLTEVSAYLLSGVAACALFMVGFAPGAWLFSVSTYSIAFMGVLHLSIWWVGTMATLRLLNLALGNGRSIFRGHLLLWCVMFVLVCLQMTTTLRPLLGPSDRIFTTEKKFFLAHWWDSLHDR